MFPSLITSFAFGLSSYMIGLLEFGSDGHTLIWFPLLFLCTKRFLEKRNGRYIVFLSITLAISVFAGQLQYVTHFLLLLGAFTIYYGRLTRATATVYISLGVGILLGFGLSAIQLLPSLELFADSHRGLLSAAQQHDVFANSLMAPYRHLRLFSPDIFGNPVSRDETSGYIEASGYFGIIPLFFAFCAMAFARSNPLVKFLTAVFVLAFLFSLQSIGEVLYILKIPVITSGQADRISTLILFSGAFLAGFGLTAWLKEHRKKQFLSIIGFVALYLILMGFYAVFLKPATGSLNLFLHNIRFPSLILGMFVIGSLLYFFFLPRFRQKQLVTVLFLLFLVAITFFDLFRLGYRFLTFSNEKFLYPQMGVTTFVRDAAKKSLGRTFGLTEPELGTYLNVYTLETYNPLYLRRTSTVLQTLQQQSPHAVSRDNKYFLTAAGDDLKRALDFAGTKYIVTTIYENPSIKHFKTDKFQNGFTKIYADDRYAVYENLQAYPRFGLYYQHALIKNDTDALETIRKGETNLRTTLLLEETLPIALRQGSGSATLVSSTVNRQTFHVTTDKPALFYISDTFYPGWKATVNKQEAKIYRANYNFRAVLVPKGQSLVEFAYMPMNFVIGMVVSILSALLLLIISFKARSQ